MSCMESKLVFRCELPELYGMSYEEVLPYFTERIGNPSYIDENDGVINYFEYEGNLQPVYDYDNNVWGIDYIAGQVDENKHDDLRISLSVHEIEMIFAELFGCFSINEDDVRLVSYSWYNGADEPISFDD